MAKQRSANIDDKQDQKRSKRDGKVRRAIRKLLQPKKWADNVIGRPVEGAEQIKDLDQPPRPKS